MKIKEKTKQTEFNEYFKTVEYLKLFIKESNRFINVDKLHDKFVKIYNELSESKESIREGVLDWYIIQKLGFKKRSAFKIDFWLERGYGINEFNDWLKKRRNLEVVKPLVDVNENHFQYGKFKFKSFGHPKCRLCGSELLFDILTNTYIVIGCSNHDCTTNFNKDKTRIRQLAFLPSNMFESKNKRINIKSKLTQEYWLLNGLSYIETLIKITEIKNEVKGLAPLSKDYKMITEELSEEEAILVLKLQTPFSIEYWMSKGYSEIIAIDMVRDIQLRNANKLKEKRIKEPELYSATCSSQLAYWTHKGYSDIEAKLKLSERQTTFSLDICIKKYGEIDGAARFAKRQEKWLSNYKKTNFSKISQKLFWGLIEEDSRLTNHNIYFATYDNGNKSNDGVNYEYKLNLPETTIKPDFILLDEKKIIEFDGVYYHKKTPENMIRETKRNNIILNGGYSILHINELEYKNNPKDTIKKCLDFLFN